VTITSSELADADLRPELLVEHGDQLPGGDGSVGVSDQVGSP
jgi:hypothetical protein